MSILLPALQHRRHLLGRVNTSVIMQNAIITRSSSSTHIIPKLHKSCFSSVATSTIVSNNVVVGKNISSTFAANNNYSTSYNRSVIAGLLLVGGSGSYLMNNTEGGINETKCLASSKRYVKRKCGIIFYQIHG